MCSNRHLMRAEVLEALRDEERVASLSPEERAVLPVVSVGEIELSDEDLDGVAAALRVAACSCQCSCHNCGSML